MVSPLPSEEKGPRSTTRAGLGRTAGTWAGRATLCLCFPPSSVSSGPCLLRGGPQGGEQGRRAPTSPGAGEMGSRPLRVPVLVSGCPAAPPSLAWWFCVTAARAEEESVHACHSLPRSGRAQLHHPEPPVTSPLSPEPTPLPRPAPPARSRPPALSPALSPHFSPLPVPLCSRGFRLMSCGLCLLREGGQVEPCPEASPPACRGCAWGLEFGI